MIEIPSLRPETRYGIPTADLYLLNRLYIVGYSFLFRQPRWALELIDEQSAVMPQAAFKRLDNFREDLRIPDMFRATLDDYKGEHVHAGRTKQVRYDRGHLVSSADRRSRPVINSETFLMSNMAPQAPGFNRGIWVKLEKAVRKLAELEDVVEVYAVCGPLFSVGDPIDVIGKNKVVVPDAFFKSVLAEQIGGRLHLWSFMIPNAEKQTRPLKEFLVSTANIERRAGLSLWDRLRGMSADGLKRKIPGDIWTLTGSRLTPRRKRAKVVKSKGPGKKATRKKTTKRKATRKR